jgi:antirestriction protein ArdC
MANGDVPAREDPLARVHEQLTAAVAELARSHAWLRMLQVAARFPRYSPSNVLLIAMQRPDASRLAGIRLWNSLGRRVRKGEKGVAILAPCLYKGQQEKVSSELPTKGSDDGPGEIGRRTLRGFRVVHVFDVAQTEGEPLPEVAPSLLLGAAPARLWESLAGLVERDAYSLERGDCGGANGFTRFDERLIRIRDDVEPAQASKTLAHELGHVRAEHDTRFADQYRRSVACRGVAEVEAESIAFLVAASAGLDSSNYTVPYVAGWAGGDVDLLKGTATRVLAVSRAIVDDAGIADQGQDALMVPLSRPCPPSDAAQVGARPGRTVTW